jgi:hypothetical protein
VAQLPEISIAFIVSALLTLFDLDRTFYVPSNAERKAVLYAWWWGFILANGLISAALYAIFGDASSLKPIDPRLRAAMFGAAYQALIRLKFTTFTLQGQEVPFGLEAFYEGVKNFVYKRKNRIAKAARYDETIQMAGASTLAQLISRARISINQDAIMTPDQKRAALTWLVSVVQDAGTQDDDKRAAIADFILSGQRVQ